MFPFVSVAEIFTVGRKLKALQYILKFAWGKLGYIPKPAKNHLKTAIFKLSDLRGKKF